MSRDEFVNQNATRLAIIVANHTYDDKRYQNVVQQNLEGAKGDADRLSKFLE